MKGKTHIASIPFCFLLFFQLTCQLNFICPRIRLSLLSNTLYLIQLWPNCMVLPVQAQLYGGEPTRTFRRYSTFPCVLFPTLFPPHGNPHILIFPCFLLFSPTHQEAYIVSAWHSYNTLVFMRWRCWKVASSLSWVNHASCGVSSYCCYQAWLQYVHLPRPKLWNALPLPPAF